ncbi:DUF2712 domain-containing protein [Bacillus sp. BS3(2021)]|uniref:DUF2712 domain-containing protein n=1 Tax=Bacillus TaxID=1386 RepID=UPI001E2AD001|nr:MULTISPECIES: DUF2712 domain-containing protein [Bacillus]MCD2368421.1 DUF2712 domain-containing protein [Bacillus sp. BS3(2021)]MCJ8229814.1 DUF2712 domain-containing protein [Bacillus paralicheniformis]
MLKVVRKNFRLILAGTLGICIMASGNFVEASNDNYSFGEPIKPYHSNSYTSERWRQTTHTNNPWKVNLKESDEGKGTITTFWIANTMYNSIPLASKTYNVKQGSGNHYYNANKKGNEAYVTLGMENNNYSPNWYYVKGVWDEETW